MLVLTRKRGEEILIGDDIRLIVSRIAGNRVSIGIAAPGNVEILRGELGAATVQGNENRRQEDLPTAL